MSILGAVGGLAGTLINRSENRKALKKEHARQDTAIQRRVADSKAAGIHPLYGLGASVSSYSPGTVGSDLGSMGQDIGRAAEAVATPAGKVDAYTKAVQSLQLRKMSLENDLLASKIATINQPGTPPGMPAEKIVPPERTPWMNTFHGQMLLDPGVANAQTVEDRWGDVMQNIYGLGNWARDMHYTYYPGSLLEKYDKGFEYWRKNYPRIRIR